MIKPKARIYFISGEIKNILFATKLILLFVSYQSIESITFILEFRLIFGVIKTCLVDILGREMF